MSFLLSVLLVNAPAVDTNRIDIVFAHPDAPINCPVFVDKEVVLPVSQQYRLCLNQIVRPLEVLCVQEGFERAACKDRTLMWIIEERLKRMAPKNP